ncbi:hypothetical protein [Streptomyces sp. Root1310]|uniref:hypothetical protein n=1 Tax=Streptomyces sp. Root1310 TaxID=1736452 RepID=UPI00070FA23F|nr:hypothetical protein [Streptomyces sp. Root1310]KQX65406.1 hypothetical protein ASD48_20355 [Streptomyces sp. Root1310]
MGQSLSHRLPLLPWGRKGAKDIGVVVVIVIVSMSLSAAQIAACAGLLSAVASVMALSRRHEGGVLRQQA